MCPDPQLLSIYVDGELPSPWNEKMESHLSDCPNCREKLENFKQLHTLFKKDTTSRRTYIERVVNEPAEPRTYTEEEMIDEAKNRIWRNMENRRRFRPNHGFLRRRLSVPLSAMAAAAAAIIVALVSVFLLRGIQINNNDSSDRVDFILAAEDQIPGFMPVSNDLSSVLQYLGAESTEIIILRLPETSNFSRAGEPAILRAADYQRNEMQRARSPRNDGVRSDNGTRDGSRRVRQ